MGNSLISGARQLAVALLLVLSLNSAHAADFIGVRFGEPADHKTRIVFDVQGEINFRLSGDLTGVGRLIVDLDNLQVPRGGDQVQSAQGSIAGYRFAQQPNGDARFVFDFKETSRVGAAFVIEPKGEVKQHRLVIDLETASQEEFLASIPKRYKNIEDVIQASAGSPTAKSEPKPVPEKRQVKDWPTIVIDPGHGGGDPGAEGQNGTLEKEITLKAALQLAEILKAKGRYRVILTRSGDERLGVKKRATLARKARPDLFISLHADALADKDVRGSSVYTVSKEGIERSAEEARTQEDYQVNDLKMSEVNPELGSILYDVTQTATISASQKFAEILVGQLKGVAPLLNNTLRTKDLRVLLAPDVPAVLFELAFISNAKDEANLTSRRWREKTMTAVAEAIDEYFDAEDQSRRSELGLGRQAG